jgi:signal transduction histidine kinase
MLSVPLAERGPEFAATIREVALDFHRAVGRDLFDVFDERGHVLARLTDPRATGQVDADLPGVREALSGRSVSGIVIERGLPYQVAVVPVVVAGEIAGVLRIGQAIDAALAEGMRVLTRSEVSVVCDGRVTTTTLRLDGAAASLARAMADLGRDPNAGEWPFPLDVGGERHLTKAESIRGLLSPGRLTIVLQRSLQAELAFLLKMERILVVIGLIGAAVAVVAGFVAARGVTAPLMHVVKAGEELERGNFDHPLSVSTGDEVEFLARQFTTMRDSIRSSITRLEDLDRMKSNFIAIASHELRTPVTALKGFLYLLRESGTEDLDPERRELVDGLATTTDDLSRIVQEVTDMSLLDRKGLTLSPSVANVRDLVESVVAANAAHFSRRRLAVTTEIEPGLPPVSLDVERVSQALQNVVGNAIRFTPDGGSVGVSARRAGGELRLAVRDTGIGIPEAERARIFDRIYEIGNVFHHSSGTIEFGSSGIGLGLPIAKGIVEAHGGRITVESSVGEGSLFTIHIPWERIVSSEAMRGPGGPSGPADASPLDPVTLAIQEVVR